HRVSLVSPLVMFSVPDWPPVIFNAIEDGKHVLTSWQQLKGMKGLIRVFAGPGSGILVSRAVLDRLGDPWFRAGRWSVEEEHGDLEFYARVRELRDPEVPILVDLDTRMGHLSPVAAWPHQDDEGAWHVKLEWDNGRSIIVHRK